MALQIYNTLSRSKEDFVPLNPPKVGMYACGVTVYDECHLGHARALVNFDVIYRYLKHSGFDVTFVRNFTDVDDKIINRALEEKIPWNEVSEKYIKAFNRDTEALGIVHPEVEPKATENIPQIVAMIQKLMDNGYAYQAGNDIFYSVRKKADYGKLSGKKIDELESGARIEIHEAKKDPLDFTLWKASKPGEPSWDSPWGGGRPGWHIECSAMSVRYLGETFDIHGGGRDLSFPHHENEIAQSEAATGKPFARYWVHNGFVNINAEKMSKSLGNFLPIRELLTKNHPEVLRLFILAAHYRSPLDYTEANMNNARQSLLRWYTTLARIHDQCNAGGAASDAGLAEKIAKLDQEFTESMDDDFNTARVTGILFDLVREWNRVLDAKVAVSAALCQGFLKKVEMIHNVMGLFGTDPNVFLGDDREKQASHGEVTPDQIEKLIQERKDARLSKDFKRADEIRKMLSDAGVVLKDTPDGKTTWSME